MDLSGVPHLGLVLYSIKDLETAKNAINLGNRILVNCLRACLGPTFPSFVKRGELSIEEYLKKSGLLPLYKTEIKEIGKKLRDSYVEESVLKITVKLEKFVVGMGEQGAFEVGISLHPIYGIPYLPGSAIKGAMRAVLPVLSPDIQEERIFGGSSGGERAGSLDFTDGMIENVREAKIYLEVIAPHIRPAGGRKGNREKVLNEQDNPIPISFIAVKNAEVVFYAISTGREGSREDLISLYSALRKMASRGTEMEVIPQNGGIPIISIGAKTSSGFGRMKIIEVELLRGEEVAALCST